MKFSPAFFKRRHEPTVASVALRRARKLPIGVFFLIAFSFAAAMAKEKAGWQKSFVLSVGGIWILYGRGEHCSPAKYHKVTFPFSRF